MDATSPEIPIQEKGKEKEEAPINWAGREQQQRGKEILPGDTSSHLNEGN